jgi:uncharacterized protein (TIGR00369 family)
MSDDEPNASPAANTMSGKPSGFRTLVGYRCSVWSKDYAEIELQITPNHTNSLGIVHGGVLMTIMDAAMGHAATWCSVAGNVRICVTVAMSISFMAPVRTGRIRAIARLIGVHDRVATITADVLDEDGQLIAAGQASFRYARGGESHEGMRRAQAR